MGKLSTMKPTLSRMPSVVKAMPKVASSIYQSKEWRELIVHIKRMRGSFCQICGSSHRVIGDHVQELRDGGAPLDEGNVELLCQACHNTKTAKSRAARAKGA